MARKRTWTHENPFLSLLDTGAQDVESLTGILKIKVGVGDAGLKGYTLSRIIGQAHVVNLTTDTSAALGSFVVGIGVYSRFVDAGDFPDLRFHDGDWPYFQGIQFKGAGTGLTPVEPEDARNILINAKSQRVLRSDDDVFLVGQLDSTAVAVTIGFSLSLLWLLPE